MANDNTPRNYDNMGDEHGRGQEEISNEGSYGKPDGMQWTEYENRREEANQDLSQVNRQVEPSIDKSSDLSQEPEPEIDNSPEPQKAPEVTEPEKDNNPEPQKEVEANEPEPEWTQSIGKTSEGRYEDTPAPEQAPEPQKEVEEKSVEVDHGKDI